MPLPTRSRPPTAPGNQVTGRVNGHDSGAKPSSTSNSTANTSSSSSAATASAASRTAITTLHHHRPRASHRQSPRFLDVHAELPPAKRARLSDQGRQQTTLENFLVARPKPPTKISLAEPHGLLVEIINGVQHVLDVNADALSPPDSRSRTPSKDSASGAAPRRTPILAKQDEKRTLRSQDDGPKLKSELATYFPNYSEIIYESPRESEFITVDSVIYITDDVPKSIKSESDATVKSTKASSSRSTTNNVMNPPSTPQRAASNQFNGSPSLNLDFVAKTLPDNPSDPLTDDFYLKSHRRAERKEKQLRNIEKERAMHEKVQLDRLLDGLLGHDWLRVMGITAITDSEAKKYEVKRDYFIAEVRALVDKFKQWKEQEKKQKQHKEAILAAREATEDPETDESSVGSNSSDLNASAAMQLQQETASAVKAATVARSHKGKDPLHAAASLPPRAPPYIPPPPEVPITSFYEKRHLRDAALGKSRHGRNVTAFGLPIPDLPEQEFVLPEDYVTEDTIRANARERRRRKRAIATDGSNA